jgi:hypothetical protein
MLATPWVSMRNERTGREILPECGAAFAAWFTEGFDSRDLVDVKALLAELGGNPVSTRRDVP